MSRSESKIPLILTVLFLGYVVYRAVGYVNDHQRAVSTTQSPVIQAEAKEPEGDRQLVANNGQPATLRDSKVRATQGAVSTEEPGTNPNGEAQVFYEGPSKTKNKKIWGAVQADVSN